MAAAREKPRRLKLESPAQARERDALQRQLGARVAELREALGWTQARLAERLRIMNPRYVQSIELGRQNLTIGSLQRLAKVLGVSVAELFEKPQSRTRKVGRPATR